MVWCAGRELELQIRRTHDGEDRRLAGDVCSIQGEQRCITDKQGNERQTKETIAHQTLWVMSKKSVIKAVGRLL